MRRLLAGCAAVACLSGCFLEKLFREPETHGPTESRTAEAYGHVPPVWDRHLYAPPASLAAGTTATYQIDGTHTLELTVRGDGWIEVIDTREARGVSLRHVTDDGRVDRAYYAEPPFGAVVPQSIVQAPAGLRPAGFEPIDGRLVRGEGTIEEYEDPLGFPLLVETEWSRDVPPILAGSDRGGLVLRATPKIRVELVRHGRDAAPRFSPPQ